MKSIAILFLIFLVISCNHDRNYLKRDVILSNMQNVADYELAHPTHENNVEIDYNNGWVPSTFYVSLIPLFEASDNARYLSAVKDWGNSFSWDCAPRFRHADDLVCGQVFLDLYRHKENPIYVEKLAQRLDSLVATEIPGREDWSWCDALFMAPSVYMMAGDILGDSNYYDYANRMYWDTYDYLFDKNDSLFYRDAKYFTKRSPNGRKVFWGRGNGWVLGGLARMIPYIKKDSIRQPYVELFKQMAKKIAGLQQQDGMWRSNLLDVNDWPQKEASSSGFFTYALAWGINYGVLDENIYRPIVEKGWIGLSKCINEETGMIGWVQPIGAAPGETNENTTMSYGAGAYVLAGTEMLKLSGSPDGPKQ